VAAISPHAVWYRFDCDRFGLCRLDWTVQALIPTVGRVAHSSLSSDDSDAAQQLRFEMIG
jgi:hypothetical protein